MMGPVEELMGKELVKAVIQEPQNQAVARSRR